MFHIFVDWEMKSCVGKAVMSVQKTQIFRKHKFLFTALKINQKYVCFILHTRKILINREHGLTRLVARGCRSERAAPRARRSTAAVTDYMLVANAHSAPHELIATARAQHKLTKAEI